MFYSCFGATGKLNNTVIVLPNVTGTHETTHTSEKKNLPLCFLKHVLRFKVD